MTDQGNAGDPYFLVELLAKSLEYIIPKLEKVWGVGTLPELGIVCGSGLSTMADALDAVSLEIPFGNIPNFPLSSVAGHAGLLIFGKIEGLHVVLLSGRVHYYEGYTPQQASYPIFLLSGLGVSSIVLSNAAGGLSINYKVGNIVVITDHLYLAGISGMSPLVGPHIAIPKILSSLRNLSHYTALKSRINGRNSERFTALNGIYSAHLRRLFGQAIVDTGAFEAGQIHCGVYAYTAGPQYESPAETVALRNMGADAVGMSTIPEVLVAAQYGIQIFAFSLITNVIPKHELERSSTWPFDGTINQSLAEGVPGPMHEEVLLASKKAASKLSATMKKFCKLYKAEISAKE